MNRCLQPACMLVKSTTVRNFLIAVIPNFQTVNKFTININYAIKDSIFSMYLILGFQQRDEIFFWGE